VMNFANTPAPRGLIPATRHEGAHCRARFAPERLERSGLCIVVVAAEHEPRHPVALALAGEHDSAQIQPATAFGRRMTTPVRTRPPCARGGTNRR
jgi:hypothetical protein